MIATTHYLYRLRPTRKNMVIDGPTPEEIACVQRHYAYLQELASRDVMVLAGRTLNSDENTFGIAILRAASEEEARNIMQNDPAVVEGVMHAELFPYRIAVFNAAASEPLSTPKS